MENIMGDRHHKQCLTRMTALIKAEYQNSTKKNTNIKYIQLLIYNYWWPDQATKIINYQFLVARTGNLVARKKKSEMNGGNIRLRMTLKINVGCLSYSVGNDAKINVGCLSLVSEMNGGNIRLRMTLK